MKFKEPTCLGTRKPTGFTEIDDPDVLKVWLYGLNISELCIEKNSYRKRRYILELHCYDGFAFIKFYPHCKKNHPNKYQLRSNSLGFTISKSNFMQIIYSCAWVMNDYLRKNPHCFIGYVGQPDKKDDLRNRKFSQRASIYDPLIANIFKKRNKYRMSSEKIYEIFNMKLIRKYTPKHKNGLSPEQNINYTKFTHYFESKTDHIRNLMTARGWQIFNES